MSSLLKTLAKNKKTYFLKRNSYSLCKMDISTLGYNYFKQSPLKLCGKETLGTIKMDNDDTVIMEL